VCEQFTCGQVVCVDNVCVSKLCVDKLVWTSCVSVCVCKVSCVDRRRAGREAGGSAQPKTRTPHKDGGK